MSSRIDYLEEKKREIRENLFFTFAEKYANLSDKAKHQKFFDSLDQVTDWIMTGNIKDV